MKIKPRPIIKITIIAEIVPDKYPESAFLNSDLKLPKATETVHCSGADLCMDAG